MQFRLKVYFELYINFIVFGSLLKVSNIYIYKILYNNFHIKNRNKFTNNAKSFKSLF